VPLIHTLLVGFRGLRSRWLSQASSTVPLGSDPSVRRDLPGVGMTILRAVLGAQCPPQSNEGETV
jgi:hypothetical protein